jgi:hypothetical protein
MLFILFILLNSCLQINLPNLQFFVDSFVYILFFIGQMESEIGEANSHIFIFGWRGHFLMAISW